MSLQQKAGEAGDISPGGGSQLSNPAASPHRAGAVLQKKLFISISSSSHFSIELIENQLI